MKKFIKTFILMIVIMFSSIQLSGCSSFFGDPDEGITIQEITTNTNEDGSITVTITYTDEERDPTVFVIPKAEKGETGEPGNGIKDITYSLSENKDTTIVTITYTDETVEPTVVNIPNGISVVGTEYAIDDITGNTYIYLTFSDGTKSKAIPVMKGKDGVDGNGITGIDQVVNEDKSVTLTFHFSQSEDVVVQIPAPEKGETGKGIETIVAGEFDGKYMMYITYTDGEIQTLSWTKPKDPNRWYTGSDLDDVKGKGVEGDFFFDIFHNNIYVKSNGEWVIVVDFDDDEQKYSVKFDLNDTTEEPASMPGALPKYDIPRGSYFKAAGYGDIPTPTRNGYTFVGWYTTRVITPTSGKFTDLTPVFGDLTLYAIWEANN